MTSIQLTAAQQRIVDAPPDGAKVVSAGPGAGKTLTMAFVYNAWVTRHQIDPQHIVAVTFSKAMADELGARIQRYTPNAYLDQICTIHALHYRILRAEGEQRTPPPAKAGWKIKVHTQTALERNGLADVGWKDAQAYIGTAKVNSVRPAALESFYDRLLHDCEDGIPTDSLHVQLAETHRLFDRLMAADRAAAHPGGLMTFADMVCELFWLFEDHPGICHKYQSRYQYMIIDEAQDTTGWATESLWNLAAPQDNILVIGDEDQWLYGFVNAEPDINMRHGFAKRFPKAQYFKLETNFRSTSSIVRASNQAIDPNYGEHNRQYQKTLEPRPDAPDGETLVYNVYEDPGEEANAVAETIAEAVERGEFEYGDFFVGSRTRAYLGYMEGALVRHSIPFVNEKGGTFWGSKHVQQLLCYMRLSADRGDDEAFETVYNVGSEHMTMSFDKKDRETGRVVKYKGEYSHTRWLGKEFVKACSGGWYGLRDAELSENGWRWRHGIGDFRRFMDNVDAVVPPGEKARYVLDHCLLSYWQAEEGVMEDDESETSRLGDLLMVCDMAREFKTCEAFFEYVRQMIDAAEAAKQGDKSAMVVLTTIHGLKGRERPYVVGVGIMDGLLPHAFSVNPGLLAVINSKSRLPALARGGNSVEAERCMWFVLISRAKARFMATGSRFVINKSYQPSRFAGEIGLLDEDLAGQLVEFAEMLEDDERGDIHPF